MTPAKAETSYERTMQPVFYIGNKMFVPSANPGVWVAPGGEERNMLELISVGARLRRESLAPQGFPLTDWISKVRI
jgi:hypothetical protein